MGCSVARVLGHAFCLIGFGRNSRNLESRGAIDITKPYKFIGFGPIDITKPCKFIGSGAIYIIKPYNCLGFGAIGITKPHKCF